MRRTGLILIILGIWVASLGALRHHYGLAMTPNFILMRFMELGEQARDNPKGQTLLIGDSISMMNGASTLCGHDLFNAGISGTDLGDWNAAAPKLTKILKPDTVVIALGTNDALVANDFDRQRWRAAYRAMIAATPAAHHVLVPPPLLSTALKTFDQDRLAAIREEVAAVSGPGISKSAVPVFDTIDGCHPDGRGLQLWRETVERACVKPPSRPNSASLSAPNRSTHG